MADSNSCGVTSVVDRLHALPGLVARVGVAIGTVAALILAWALFRNVAITVEPAAGLPTSAETGLPTGPEADNARAFRHDLYRTDSLLRGFLADPAHGLYAEALAAPDAERLTHRIPSLKGRPTAAAAFVRRRSSLISRIEPLPEAVAWPELRGLSGALEYLATALGRRISIHMEAVPESDEGPYIRVDIERGHHPIHTLCIPGNSADAVGTAAAAAYLVIQPPQSEIRQVIRSPAALWQVVKGLHYWDAAHALPPPPAPRQIVSPPAGSYRFIATAQGATHLPAVRPTANQEEVGCATPSQARARALACFRAAQKLAPQEALPHLCLAMCLASRTRLESANGTAAATDEEPPTEQATDSTDEARDEARDEFLRSIGCCPPGLTRWLACVYHQLGALDRSDRKLSGDALRHLYRATDLNPDDSVAWYYIGDAESWLAMRVHPDHRWLHESRAWRALRRARQDPDLEPEALRSMGVISRRASFHADTLARVACLQTNLMYATAANARSPDPRFAQGMAEEALWCAWYNPRGSSAYHRIALATLDELGDDQATRGAVLVQTGQIDRGLECFRHLADTADPPLSVGRWVARFPKPNPTLHGIAAVLLAGRPGECDDLLRELRVRKYDHRWPRYVKTIAIIRLALECCHTRDPDFSVDWRRTARFLVQYGKRHELCEGLTWLDAYLAAAGREPDRERLWTVYDEFLWRDPATNRAIELVTEGRENALKWRNPKKRTQRHLDFAHSFYWTATQIDPGLEGVRARLGPRAEPVISEAIEYAQRLEAQPCDFCETMTE